MLLAGGIVVSYESIRRWVVKFGPRVAQKIRRRAPQRGDIWHLDEVRIKMNDKVYWLWRAVDQDGFTIHEVLQSKRDTKAAKRLLLECLKEQGWHRPKRIVTDKLGSYGAAKREVLPSLEHRSHKGLNNRAENSHLPFRRRERHRQRFKSPGSLQRFIVPFSAIRDLFYTPAKKRSALNIHLTRINAFAQWNAITGKAIA